jgi:hypothetical protein
MISGLCDPLVFLTRQLSKICKIFLPNILSNEELWRCAQQKPVAGSANHTVEMDVDQTYSEEGILPQTKKLGTPKDNKGWPRRSWRRMTEEETETMGKTWMVVKAVPGNTVRWCCFMEALHSEME